MNSSEQAAAAAPVGSSETAAGGLHGKDRPDALAAGEQAIAHGAVDGFRRGRFRRHQAVELGIHELLLPGQVFAEVHAFFGTERLGLDLAFFADQHFDARLGVFQLLAAGFAEAHPFLKQLERSLQRQIAGSPVP